jgi:hypothetical protein
MVHGSKVEILVEIHREALASLNQAANAHSEITDQIGVYLRKNPIFVPLAPTPDGKSPSGWYDLGETHRSIVEECIEKIHVELVSLHCSDWARKMAPERTGEMEAALDASKARAFVALEAGAATLHEIQGKFGLDGARLLIYRPKTGAEADVKSNYVGQLEENDLLREHEPDFMLQMIKHLSLHSLA